MAKKKHKQSQPHKLSSQDLKARAQKARNERRTQQALELTKQLHRFEPTPEHLDMLKEVYLERARELRERGYVRDAVNVLEVALGLEGQTPAWLEKITAELAECGASSQVLSLLDRLGASGSAVDPQTQKRLQGQAVDAALQRESAGRASLPTELQPEFDRILTAFAQLERGEDDACQATLQGIALRSPFLEWKLFLRGLQAYYQNEDTRALDNWRRLNPDRLPCRLAAPFRAQLDSEYARAQPPATQVALRQQMEKLRGDVLLTQLGTLRQALEQRHDRGLVQAFRLAETVLPQLQTYAPDLVPRLASCFYWAITETGPEDLNRYQRVFGAPVDDVQFFRLQALAHDKLDNLERANHFWQLYEQEIAAHPELWSGAGGTSECDRARALVWYHMGTNAAVIPGPGQRAKMPAALRNDPTLPPSPDPSAEHCLQRSLELAPDIPEAYQALFNHLLAEHKESRAIKVGERMLERFGDHVDMLSDLADLLLRNGKTEQSLEYFHRALKGNPLDRRLRDRVGKAHLLHSGQLLLKNRLEEAFQNAQAAQSLADPRDVPMILCRQASCALKGGANGGGVGEAETGAEALLEQARTRSAPLVVTYIMLTEAATLKLAREIKDHYTREFNNGIKQTVSGPEGGSTAAGLARFVAYFKRRNLTYHGQKTHDKKIQAYLERARNSTFTETQAETICEALVELGSKRAARQYAQMGQRQFPNNPWFYYYEAMTYVGEQALRGRRLDTIPDWQVSRLLERAQELARALPPGDERIEAMLEDIEGHLHALDALNPFRRMFTRFPFGGMFNLFEDPFDDFFEDI